MKKIKEYIRQIFEGPDGKPSLRAWLAVIVVFHALFTISWAFSNVAHKSPEGAISAATIEFGFATALLGISAYQGVQNKKEDTKKEIAATVAPAGSASVGDMSVSKSTKAPLPE